MDTTKHLAYWLRQLHPDSTYARLVFQGAWRTGPDGELIKGKWSETQIDPSNGAVDVILSRPDCNTFVSPAQVSGHDDASFISSRAVWADVDPDSPDEFTDQWRTMLRPVAESLGAMIVASGRGYHVYLMLDEALRDAQRLRRLNSALTQLLRGDRSSVNPSRVLRVPGTYHCKTDRRPVVRVIKKPTRHWSVEELEAELAPQMRDAPLLAGPLDEEWRTVDVSHVNKALTFSIRQRGEESGDRSELCYWAIRECQEKGLTRDEAHSLLSEFGPGVSKYRSRWHKEIDRIWAKQTPSKAEMSDSPFEEAPGRLKLRRASEFKIRKVLWGWQDRMPVGEITLIPGREGTGKSTLLAWMAAQITNGTLDGEFKGQKRAVLYAASEDAWEYTIVPRMKAAGADLDLVYQLDVQEGEHGLVLPADCDELVQAALSVNAAALMLDPILSYVDGAINVNQSQQLRKALEPLKRAAEEASIMVLALAHFNKTSDTDLLSKIPGSRAWTEVARAVFGVVKDGDADRYIASTIKNSLGRMDLRNLTYTLQSCTLKADNGEEAEVAKLVWGEDSDESVEQVMNRKPSTGRPVSKTTQEIVQYVLDWGSRIKVSDVQEFFKDTHKPATVAKVLKRADERGELSRPAWGMYAPPVRITPEPEDL